MATPLPLPAPTSGPNLAELIKEWLPKEYRNEWYIHTNIESNNEFKQMWPNLDTRHFNIGQLNGWGWIINIYEDRVETFQDLPWVGVGSEKRPLMAADPNFFRNLETLMECIIESRNRERIERRKNASNT